MARNVTYSVVPRINPREKSDPPKYYAQAQASGDVNIREMSERIQQTCTVTKAELAQLYSPHSEGPAALQTLYRWMRRNESLMAEM